MRRLLIFSSSLLILLTLGGCNTSRNAWEPIGPDDYISKTYTAVDNLVSQIETRSNKEVSDRPIIVATLVNIDDLTESSRLGRSLSEQVASRLTQRGYKVVELKLRGNIFVQHHQGELLLSRELKDISLSHRAQAVVVGTYALASSFIHVNLKLVSGDTQHALGAADYGLPLDANTRALLYRPR